MTFAALPLLTLALAGCQQAAEEPAVAEEGTAPQVKLPVPINAAMVGIIDQSADYIWAVGNGDLPRDDHDWDQVRGAVYDMILGGQLIQIEGTGEYDAQWVANQDWQKHSNDLTQIGQDALPLAEAKSTDVEAWRAIGDRLVQNCLACHELFKPEVPSQGILHESTVRESLGESIFD
ncbi:hypothetical protein [Alteraurantiacibacter aestuarii]|uniref:hypothetical protein n=1 Tax=Alteraurantiacibacter aestuarii TaxID=650004 RepID=UPI0031D6431B